MSIPPSGPQLDIGFEHLTLLARDPEEARGLFVRLAVRRPSHLTSGGPSHLRGVPFAEATVIAFDHTHEELRGVEYREAPLRADKPRARHLAVKTIAHHRADASTAEVAGVHYDGTSLAGAITHGDARIAFDLAVTPSDEPPIVLYNDRHLLCEVPMPRALVEGSIELDAPSGNRWWPVRGWRFTTYRHGKSLSPHAFAFIDGWNEPEGRAVLLAAALGRAELRIGPRVVRVSLHASPGEIGSWRRWTMAGRADDGTRLRADLVAATDDRVGIYTPSVHGTMTYAIYSHRARAELRVAPHAEAPLLLTSDVAFLEIVARDAYHGARMYV